MVMRVSLNQFRGGASESFPWGFLAVAGTALALPAAVTRFPPITDLPQLLGQVPLFVEAVSSPESDLVVQWWAPNQLFQVLAGLSWLVVGPAFSGSVSVMLVIACWLAALLVTAARGRRSFDSALIASLLIFNHSFYYGFLNFVLGAAAFLLWAPGWNRSRAPGDRDGPVSSPAAFALMAFLTYKSHLLWFFFGCATWAVGLALAWHRSGPRSAAFRSHGLRSLALLPWLVLGLRFGHTLAAGDFVSRIRWGEPPVVKLLSLDWWRVGALGGLRGPTDTTFLALLLLLAVLSLVRNRHHLRSRIDRTLLALGAVLVLGAVLLPEMVGRTTHFGSRWVAPGFALILLGLPPIGYRKWLIRSLVIAVMWTYCGTTAITWYRAERLELAGFEGVLEEIPRGTRLMGLIRREQSDYIAGFPYYHLYAWAQVYRGARLHFSFADHPTSPVVFRDLPRQLPYHPGQLQPRDLVHFDHLLVFGPAAGLSSGTGLRKIAEAGDLTLFEINLRENSDSHGGETNPRNLRNPRLPSVRAAASQRRQDRGHGLRSASRSW